MRDRFSTRAARSARASTTPHSSMPPTTTAARCRVVARAPRWIARARGTGTSTIARAWSKKDDDEIWDEDERRRVEENKRWRRTDDPSEAWDIDKERDALMYKRESLEALLRVEYEPEEGRGEAKDDDDDDARA